MGCGRVGSTIAHILEDQGHSVAIIDQDAEAFRKLRSGFKGSKITGTGFDREILIEAGIERADAFAAVSSGDNSNVIAARVARESFDVHRVSWRESTIRAGPRYTSGSASPPWRPSAGPRTRCCAGCCPRARSRSGGIRPAPSCSPRSPARDAWLGEKVQSLEETARTRIAFISRLGEAMLPGPGTVLQEGDVLHVIAQEGDIERIAAVFARPSAPGKGGH